MQFLLKYKQSAETEIVKKQYKISMALAACALWQRVKNKEKKEDIIDIGSSAISQIILSAVRQLGKLSGTEAQKEEEPVESLQ